MKPLMRPTKGEVRKGEKSYQLDLNNFADMGNALILLSCPLRHEQCDFSRWPLVQPQSEQSNPPQMLKTLSATWTHIEGAVTTKQSQREKKRLHIRSNSPGFKRHWRLQVIRGG